MSNRLCWPIGLLLPVAALIALPGAVLAGQSPLPADRATIEACLKREKTSPATCINRIYAPCSAKPAGSSTVGMEDCAARELGVWDERLNAAYRKLVGGDLGKVDALPENRPTEAPIAKAVKGAVILADMEKAWLAYRTRKCDASALTAEGGTLARTIYSACYLDETARQALFLQSIVDDLAAR